MLRDDNLVKSVSRDGARDELLRGPLYYCLILISLTLLYWRETPTGLVAISMMCGGDGLADIVGRRFGSAKLPYNGNKSWAGSVAMFLAGLAFSMGFIALFAHLGMLCNGHTVASTLPTVAVVCLACTIVESLPINQWIDDNISVPAVAVAAMLLATGAVAS